MSQLDGEDGAALTDLGPVLAVDAELPLDALLLIDQELLAGDGVGDRLPLAAIPAPTLDVVPRRFAPAGRRLSIQDEPAFALRLDAQIPDHARDLETPRIAPRAPAQLRELIGRVLRGQLCVREVEPHVVRELLQRPVLGGRLIAGRRLCRSGSDGTGGAGNSPAACLSPSIHDRRESRDVGPGFGGAGRGTSLLRVKRV